MSKCFTIIQQRQHEYLHYILDTWTVFTTTLIDLKLFLFLNIIISVEIDYLWYLNPDINVFMATDKCFVAKTADHFNFLAWMKHERSLDTVLTMNV